MKKASYFIGSISIILLIIGILFQFNLHLSIKHKKEDQKETQNIIDNNDEMSDNETNSIENGFNENFDNINHSFFKSSYWDLSETDKEYILTLSSNICNQYSSEESMKKQCVYLKENPLVFSKTEYTKIIPSQYGLDSSDKGQVSLFVIDNNNNVKRLSIEKFWNDAAIVMIDVYSNKDAIDIISVPDAKELYPFYEEIKTPVGTYGYEMFIVTLDNNYIRIDDELREETKKIN